MKALLLSGWILFCCTVYAQENHVYPLLKVEPATQKPADSCKPADYLFQNKLVKKKGIQLIVPMRSTRPRVFTDDTTAENFRQYFYVGDVQQTSISVIRQQLYNEEFFYLLNQVTGRCDTLIGLPAFDPSMRRFVCINNPLTDQPWLLQTGVLNNERITRKQTFQLKGTTPSAIVGISMNTVWLDEQNKRLWKAILP